MNLLAGSIVIVALKAAVDTLGMAVAFQAAEDRMVRESVGFAFLAGRRFYIRCTQALPLKNKGNLSILWKKKHRKLIKALTDSPTLNFYRHESEVLPYLYKYRSTRNLDSRKVCNWGNRKFLSCTRHNVDR